MWTGRFTEQRDQRYVRHSTVDRYNSKVICHGLCERTRCGVLPAGHMGDVCTTVNGSYDYSALQFVASPVDAKR